jgi:hypothetical protein
MGRVTPSGTSLPSFCSSEVEGAIPLPQPCGCDASLGGVGGDLFIERFSSFNLISNGPLRDPNV